MLIWKAGSKLMLMQLYVIAHFNRNGVWWTKTISLGGRCVLSSITGKIEVFTFLTTKLGLLSQNIELQTRSLGQSPPLITSVPKLLCFLTVLSVFLFQISLPKLVMLPWNTVKGCMLIKTKNCFSNKPSIDVTEKAGPGSSVMDTLMFVTCVFPSFQLLFTLSGGWRGLSWILVYCISNFTSQGFHWFK